jgi:hypothetical protein
MAAGRVLRLAGGDAQRYSSSSWHGRVMGSSMIDGMVKPSLFGAGLDPSIESLQRVAGMPSLAVNVGWTPYLIDQPGPSRSMFLDAPSVTLDGRTPSSSLSHAAAPSTVGPGRVLTTGGSMRLQRVPPPQITNKYAAPNASYLKKHEGTGERDCNLRSAAADVKGKGKARAP